MKLIRVEQLAPFPFDLVCRELRRYPNAEIMWCAPNPSMTKMALHALHTARGGGELYMHSKMGCYRASYSGHMCH